MTTTKTCDGTHPPVLCRPSCCRRLCAAIAFLALSNTTMYCPAMAFEESVAPTDCCSTHDTGRQSVSVTERHSSPDNSRAVTATTATARTASSANRSQSPWKSGSCRPLASPMMHSIAATPTLRRAVVVIIRLVSIARLSRLRLCCCACAQQGGFGVAAATRRRRTAKSIAVQSGIFAGLGEARAVRIRSQRILVQRRGCGLSRVAVEL